MGKYIGSNGLTYLWNKIKSYITSKHFAGSTADGGPANKAVSIPFGQVDSTSTSTAFTATVDGITELRDGVCVYLKNGVVSSASGYTININNLGAKPVYVTSQAASASATQFTANYTMLFVYNSSRVSGGCWDMFYGYYSDSNSIGYNIQDYAIRKPVKNVLYKYQFLFTCMDGTLLPPNSDSNVTVATHVLTKESFNPFGQVYYYNSTTTVNAGSTTASGTLYSQATYGTYPDLRYSFNTASTLVANNDIYIKCIPQPDGSAILADDAIVFALPTYEDGFIYKRLGKAYDTYRIILEQDKPVYYYKDGIKLWTGYNLQEGVMVTDEFTKKDSSVTSDVGVKSIGGKTVVWNQLCDDSLREVSGITLSDVSGVAFSVNGTPVQSNQCYLETVSLYNGHRYYFKFKVVDLPQTTNVAGSCVQLYDYTNTSIIAQQSDRYVYEHSIDGVYVFSGMFTKTVDSASTQVRMRLDSSITYVNTIFYYPILVDLTQMFGTGNEPSTVEEFERMFPEDSYAYDAGRIVNVAMTGMKSLDADGNDLDSAELDVTTLTGVADGGSTSEIIFPNGMNGIGDVRDEIDLVTGKAVKRIGVVDMGSLTWNYLSEYTVFIGNLTGNSHANLLNLLCSRYDVANIADSSAKDKSVYLRTANTTGLGLKDSSYTDAALLKTSLDGVLLYYELETPIEYTLDTTPSCVMSVVKGGKEMILPYNASEPQCAPVRIVEEYKVDYVSNKVVKSLEDRIAALEAIINNG